LPLLKDQSYGRKTSPFHMVADEYAHKIGNVSFDVYPQRATGAERLSDGTTRARALRPQSRLGDLRAGGAPPAAAPPTRRTHIPGDKGLEGGPIIMPGCQREKRFTESLKSMPKALGGRRFVAIRGDKPQGDREYQPGPFKLDNEIVLHRQFGGCDGTFGGCYSGKLPRRAPDPQSTCRNFGEGPGGGRPGDHEVFRQQRRVYGCRQVKRMASRSHHRRVMANPDYKKISPSSPRLRGGTFRRDSQAEWSRSEKDPSRRHSESRSPPRRPKAFSCAGAEHGINSTC